MVILPRMLADIISRAFFGRFDHEFCFSYQIVSAIQTRQEEQSLPETELIQCIWTGLISSVEWSARPDQHEGLIIKEVAVRKFLALRSP